MKNMLMRITTKDREAAKAVLACFSKSKTDKEIFYNLCFCLCAPQTTFKNNIKVNAELKRQGVYYWDINDSFHQELLRRALKPVRFYNNKAEYLIEAKRNFPEILKECRSNWVWEVRRTWLVKNVKGLGEKTASHFLRNLGAKNLAIIDTHILKYLGITGKWKYEDVEKQFGDIASKKKMSVAELDAIVWHEYSKTDWKDFVF